MAKLFILGAGGFGTALAVMSQANGHEVTMWSYREDEAAQLRTDRENRRLLPGVKIPEEIAIVTDFAALGEAELVLIAVLVALNVAGRAAFFMLPEFKPVVAMTILAGVAFGGETGFLVGAMTMLVSNMLFSQGPWTPWQMFAMGIIGWLAGILYRKGVLRRGRLSLCIFGVICSTIVYGGIMNPASALMWAHTINWKIILSYYVTGLPVDLVRAIATFFFLWLGAEPMLEKLDRIKTKYGLAE